jgi:hypothetical protein
LPPERTLRAGITVGEVRIYGEARRDALIEVVRTAPTTEGLTRLRVELEQDDREVRLQAVQPDDAKDPGFRTDVTLRVPHDASLPSVLIAEGRLTLASFGGTITAELHRGPIEATDVEGTIRLETTIGDVVVNRARLSPGGLLRLRTFNGDVRLTLAKPPTDARILALALNGSIESDIPLQRKDSWGPRWGEATLGTGEPVISIDVVTGRIVIRTTR